MILGLSLMMRIWIRLMKGFRERFLIKIITFIIAENN